MKCPRIAVVARRSVRKNKYIDYVAEFHLDLITKFNAIPVIIPRVSNIVPLLHSILPTVDGLLMVEGEDVSPDFHLSNPHLLLSAPVFHCVADVAVMSTAHPSDTAFDRSKDFVESSVLQFCLAHGVPILAICKGSQMLNVVCGGTLHADLESCAGHGFMKHMDYARYDSFRHPIDIVPNTPLARWFDHQPTIDVSSYHHQGIATLADRFVPMAVAPDGLVEAFHDPRPNGPFVVGMQFHPERMQDMQAALDDKSPVFEYEGCIAPYRDLVNAAAKFLRSRSMSLTTVGVKKEDGEETVMGKKKFESMRKPLSTNQLNRLVDETGDDTTGRGMMQQRVDENAVEEVWVGEGDGVF